jgi:DcmR-like sensory protein
MPKVLADLAELPVGSHCVSFHVTEDEAADHAISFLAGTPNGQAASYWVPSPGVRDHYAERLATESPDHVGCVSVLDQSQAEAVNGKRRPIQEVRSFVEAHPEGVTAAGETIAHFWTPEEVPSYLEYESWFENQRRDWSRFLCPYDLRRVPPEAAPVVMRQLGAHHSHVVLSTDAHPAVRLIQLFVFPSKKQVPEPLQATLRWALSAQLLQPTDELALTPSGEALFRDWSRSLSVDW